MNNPNSPFTPARLVRNRHLQSIAASVKLRRPFVKRRASAMLKRSREILLNCGNGVTLKAFHSPHGDTPRDLVILIHGWEGSSDSMYLLSSAGYFYNRGFDIVRLNLRDHGESHHLNRGLFHSCRLPEVVAAVKRIRSDCSTGGRVFLCGFSLGGNFALRVAAKAGENGLVLDTVVAVCPVLHPPSTLNVLENEQRLYGTYFIRKWKKSLLKKQALFPCLYDFSDSSVFRSLRAMTEEMVNRHTDYPDFDTYLNGYSLTGSTLESLDIPSHIILSRDDPVVPYQDIEQLARPAALTVTLTPYGGHCGFFKGLGMKSWINEKMAEIMSEASTGRHRVSLENQTQ